MPELTTPKAILISGILASAAILFQGQVVLELPNIKGLQKTTTTKPTTTTTPTAKYKNIREALVTYAYNLKLDQKKFEACLDSKSGASEIDGDVVAAEQAQVSATPTFIVNGVVLRGAQPFTAFKEVIDGLLSGTFVGTDPRVEVTADDDPVKGSASAPITIVEFSDYQCPFCKNFFVSTLPQLTKEYIDTGKARLVYRDLPLLAIHPNAQISAEAANCAFAQGKFWEYHDTLFANQNEWSPLP